jgi:AraC-like DNA-binding protein
MRQLGEGESVTNVALETGYEDVSSFIAAFKKSTGQTPARFFHNLS